MLSNRRWTNTSLQRPRADALERELDAHERELLHEALALLGRVADA